MGFLGRRRVHARQGERAVLRSGEDASCSITSESISRCRGPLNMPRPPQGHPVIVQAGTSDDGMDVAARFAEVIFSANLTMESCQEYFKEVKERAAQKFGRNPDHLKVMPGLSCYVGRTEEEAEEKYAAAELADASDRGARNPLDRARRHRSVAVRFRRAAAGQSADDAGQPEPLQIRHGSREVEEPDDAADRGSGRGCARQARGQGHAAADRRHDGSNGTSRKPPTASTSCRRRCRAGSTISSSW